MAGKINIARNAPLQSRVVYKSCATAPPTYVAGLLLTGAFGRLFLGWSICFVTGDPACPERIPSNRSTRYCSPELIPFLLQLPQKGQVRMLQSLRRWLTKNIQKPSPMKLFRYGQGASRWSSNSQ